MAAKTPKTLTNNTKGLRHVVGFKVLPGKSVELTAEQVELVMDNPVAKAWIEAGDLSLKQRYDVKKAPYWGLFLFLFHLTRQ